MKKEIGKKIRTERAFNLQSHYYVSKKSGLQQSVIRSIEDGDKAYTIDSLLKVCEALGLELKIVRKNVD